MGRQQIRLARESASPTEERLWQALEQVEDPEFPVSVVDMGLVYEVKCVGRNARVKMTFTAMGCPCMDMMLSDVRQRLLQEHGVDKVTIEIIWDPPWTREFLSETAIAMLKTWGVSA